MHTRLLEVKKLITEYEKKYQRESGSVRLLAVSKLQSIDKIAEVFQSGQHAFGESYLQEALAKFALLATHQHLEKEIEWHFIGPIQSNKTRKIAENFSWVQSVDNIKIAKRLNDQRPPHLPPLNICIQVNISNEATKSGIATDEVLTLAEACLNLPQLRLRGLMAIPALELELDAQRKTFHQLFSIWKFLQNKLQDKGVMLDTLSMGMSDDFEAAIAEGSTLVRIGAAIFGERPNK